MVLANAWMAERGVLVDQSTIYRWVQRFLPLFGEVARKYRDPVGPDWRVDETYARIRGRWRTTSIAPSTETARLWTPMCRRHATWFPRTFFERAIASSGTTPRRVITDKAATY